MIEKILKEINRLKGELDGYSALEALDYIESYINTISREPASEDLEEAASKYVREDFHERSRADFKAGAEWQKQRDDKHIGDLQWEAYLKGEQETKQQMMKDAVEGTIKYEIGSAEIPQCDKRYQVLSDPTPIANAKLGDKVKIIIVKTEQQ